MRIAMALLVAAVLGACQQPDRESRLADTWLSGPMCAPDGSVVWVEFANSTGDFDDIETSHENCPWGGKK